MFLKSKCSYRVLAVGEDGTQLLILGIIGFHCILESLSTVINRCQNCVTHIVFVKTKLFKKNFLRLHHKLIRNRRCKASINQNRKQILLRNGWWRHVDKTAAQQTRTRTKLMMLFAEELRHLDKRFQQRNQLGTLEVKKKAQESRKRSLEQSRFEPTPSWIPDLQLSALPTTPLKLRDNRKRKCASWIPCWLVINVSRRIIKKSKIQSAYVGLQQWTCWRSETFACSYWLQKD